MAATLFVATCMFIVLSAAADQPPSPGVYLSGRFPSRSFDGAFRNLWGSSHQRVDSNGLTIWLDRTSGSGFKSLQPFQSGYFGASIKLQSGYTAGVITTLYLSNNQDYPGNHDEIDIEFLGTTFGEPYTLQTNIYVQGSGDGRLIGREMRYHLWFDPTQDFHRYSILWTPNEIIFFVDDVPIRSYPKKISSTFPQRPMWVYGSIWDASSWATDNGRYKADYQYEPFVANFKDFKVSGCSSGSVGGVCRPDSVSPSPSGGLTGQQRAAMQWASRYMVYDYCRDNSKDHSLTPECGSR